MTRVELVAVMPLAAGVDDAVVDALDAAMRRFAIDTPARAAAFLAQLAHESGQLQRWTENLDYRWERLRQVFPRYFPTDAEARAFDRSPERIANRVYAGRMGNGPEASGDGWRYRGRGPIQLTGRDNYRACGAGIGLDLAAEPELLTTPGAGCLAAAWFWARNGLNALADAGDFVAITRKINGGVAGLAERQAFWARAKAALGVPAAAPAAARRPARPAAARPRAGRRKTGRRRRAKAPTPASSEGRARRAAKRTPAKRARRRRAPTRGTSGAPSPRRRRAGSARSRRRRA